MIHNIFSYNHFYCKFKAPNAEDLIKYVLEVDKNYTKQEWQNDCELDTISCKWQDTMPLYEPSLQKFADLIEHQFEYTMFDPWINHYKRGHFEEVHDHVPHDFSSIFFVNTGENFAKFYFFNRHSNSLPSNWKMMNFFDTFYPNIESGDIMFFPSTELHGVTAHRSDVVRKTLSCNFNFRMPV